MSDNLKTINVTIEGVSPLLMHNGQLADPLNPFTKAIKEITAKRTKTDDDHHELQRREFMGSLYYTEEDGPVLPTEMIESAIRDGGKKFKLGKAITMSVFANEDHIPLKYDGPRNRDELFSDGRFKDVRSVVIQRARTMRCRPIFKKWAADFSLTVVSDVINVNDVKRAIESSGQLSGLGDYRPKYGRFKVTKFEPIET